MATDRSTIRFHDQHVDRIMDGEKTVTIRYDFEHEFEQGDLVDLVNQNGHKLTTAKIVTQCELRADWVSFADFAGHQRYVTTGELLEELSEYYPDANLHPKVVLDVIVFETDLIVTDGGQPTDDIVRCDECGEAVQKYLEDSEVWLECNCTLYEPNFGTDVLFSEELPDKWTQDTDTDDDLRTDGGQSVDGMERTTIECDLCSNKLYIPDSEPDTLECPEHGTRSAGRLPHELKGYIDTESDRDE